MVSGVRACAGARGRVACAGADVRWRARGWCWRARGWCGRVTIHPRTSLRLRSSEEGYARFVARKSFKTEIAVISGSPKQLRKQFEKSSFGLLGRLGLHICNTCFKAHVRRSPARSVACQTHACALSPTPDAHPSTQLHVQTPERLLGSACTRPARPKRTS
ncbi:hypothetical protein CRG98_001906 [Punica granatum]|uniref:Uncharacterized protein n=1 Tax=Punica granatum TaxID=22663 RepID=A0A2I0LBV7_PUNGR|nr:hypothetical protein CRG98_001906 [Punica granatum]